MAGSKQIINAADVRARYSLQDLKDINAALESGIPGAHFFFQGVLGTTFDEETHTDVFFIDAGMIPAYNNQFRLRLTQAFVKPGSLMVAFGTKRASAADPFPVEESTIDLNRGLVFLDEPGENGSYASKFVSVSYTAGFGTGTAADVVQPPAWLKDALLAWMASVLVFSAYKEEPQKAVVLAESIKRDAAALVDRYKRETALQFLPVNF